MILCDCFKILASKAWPRHQVPRTDMQLNKYYAQYKPLRKKSHHTEPSFSLKNFLKNFTLRALSNEEKNTPCDVSEVKNIGLSNRESFFVFLSFEKKVDIFVRYLSCQS